MRNRVDMLKEARSRRRNPEANSEMYSLQVNLAEAKLLLSAHGARVAGCYGNEQKGSFVVMLRYQGEHFSWVGRNTDWARRILEKKHARRRRT